MRQYIHAYVSPKAYPADAGISDSAPMRMSALSTPGKCTDTEIVYPCAHQIKRRFCMQGLRQHPQRMSLKQRWSSAGAALKHFIQVQRDLDNIPIRMSAPKHSRQILDPSCPLMANMTSMMIRVEMPMRLRRAPSTVLGTLSEGTQPGADPLAGQETVKPPGQVQCCMA